MNDLTPSVRAAIRTDCSGDVVCRVLVLLATHNGKDWIEEQINSIAAQRGNFNLTLVVCDDNSSDNTVSLLAAHAALAKVRVEWVRSSRPGGSAGRNFFRLIDAAEFENYDFVSFADQDDIWNPEKLQRAIDKLRATGAGGYSAPVRAFWPDGKKSVLRQSKRPMLADYIFEGAGQGCTFVLSTELMKILQLELRQNYSLVQSIHYHDWTLYALSRCHGKAWLFDDWPCLLYRQHASNDTGARTTGQGLKKRLELIRSGWYGEQIHRIASLCARVESTGPGSEYLRMIAKAGERTGRIRLAIFILRHGRRKWLDRIVLTCVCLAGYLRPASQ